LETASSFLRKVIQARVKVTPQYAVEAQTYAFLTSTLNGRGVRGVVNATFRPFTTDKQLRCPL
jgi:hypothetical protein